jgi:hypothetical protein
MMTCTEARSNTAAIHSRAFEREKNITIDGDNKMEVVEWWGFNSEHGWVVLDRNIPNNRSGAAESLTFLRGSDWTHYLEKRSNWTPTYYFYEHRYLESLSHSRVEEKRKLEELKKQYREKKQEYYSIGLNFLKIETEPNQTPIFEHGGPLTLTQKPGHRTSRCWQCKERVDNQFDEECDNCGWIICSSCGACSYDCTKTEK